MNWRHFFRKSLIGRSWGDLTARADAARDSHRYAEAAGLYEQALIARPHHAGIHIQCGHMWKEAGVLDRAERHYLTALESRPHDADLAMQLGHLYKRWGKRRESRDWYRRALELHPGWREAAEEFAFARGLVAPDPPEGMSAEELTSLAPNLAPRPAGHVSAPRGEGIEITRLGRREPGLWGLRRTLCGVEAVRGYVLSATPLHELQIFVDHGLIHTEPLIDTTASADLAEEVGKYVFNAWLSVASLPLGLASIELRFIGETGADRSFHDHVVIAPAVSESEYPGSDALVAVDTPLAGSLEHEIRSRPSMIRQARRAFFPEGLNRILVLRTDQLGDMVASIPAMLRLREIAPDATIVGLVTQANADLARTLALFDELIVIEFPDDPIERRRLMALPQQSRLKARLQAYAFDLAIDLAQSHVSRDLLLLSGARFTFGTQGSDWPWLDGGLAFETPDRWSGRENAPHSAKVLALVEAIGAVARTHAPIIRRSDLGPQVLERYGIDRNDRFVVLHMGARIAFSRWPGFLDLAQLLIDRTDLKIVVMTDDPSVRASLPAGLMAQRLLLIDQRLEFDAFDAFLSFATVVVGNDSGPKHLAALRGTNVVTLFTARINWAEWGQENIGSIISRRVPCAGCAIFHDAEDCGKNFSCIRDIRVEEVFETVCAYL